MLNHHEQNIDCHLFWLSKAITAQWQRFHTSRRRSKETWIWLTPMLYAQRLTKLLCLVGSSSCGVEQLLLLVYSGQYHNCLIFEIAYQTLQYNYVVDSMLWLNISSIRTGFCKIRRGLPVLFCLKLLPKTFLVPNEGPTQK